MGLDINGVQFILYAKSLDVDFSRSAMIGRQFLCLSPSNLKTILVKFGFSFNEEIIKSIFNEDSGYAEEFLRCLGAEDIHSVDYSDYEGATHIHDMNQEIPESFRQQYSMVLDSGSLEHVFNFPVAIKNCMEMVKVGGHYLGITPANNRMGHGFYQFSPELFFNIFTHENGYELVNVIAFEENLKAKAKWFSVKSPASVKGRVTLINSNPVYLMVVAKRVDNITPFVITPQQSDYVSTWSEANNAIDKPETVWQRNRLLKAALQYTPDPIKQIVKRTLRYDRKQSGFNPRFFQLFKRTDGSTSPDKTLLRKR